MHDSIEGKQGLGQGGKWGCAAIHTSGWPRGETVGPCSEWQETICTSSGRYFSNAAFSGAFTEVCPPTIAPTFVAVAQVTLTHSVIHVVEED